MLLARWWKQGREELTRSHHLVRSPFVRLDLDLTEPRAPDHAICVPSQRRRPQGFLLLERREGSCIGLVFVASSSREDSSLTMLSLSLSLPFFRARLTAEGRGLPQPRARVHP